MCSVTKSDCWNSITVWSSIIPISLKIPGNKENYSWASRVWPWIEHALLVFLMNWWNSCARSDTFTQNNLCNWLMKNFTLPAIHLASIVLPVPGFPANIICSFDISCSAPIFLTLFLSKAALLERMLIFSFNCSCPWIRRRRLWSFSAVKFNSKTSINKNEQKWSQRGYEARCSRVFLLNNLLYNRDRSAGSLRVGE